MVDATASSPAAPHLLTTPLPDLAAWARHFVESDIPVLGKTAQSIEQLREREDDVETAEIAEVIQADPLMTIKFMAHVASHRRPGDHTETETVLSSLVMTGISPFFRNFPPQPTVEQQLQEQPLALEALQYLLKRGRRAANFALAFAVHRGDTDAPVIYQAAFLHDFAEMLLLCWAPTLALTIRDMLAQDSTLRSTAAQRQVLNIELADLRQQLFKVWRLPSLLVRISDGKHPDHPTVRNVLLGVRLARHTMLDWENAAIPDDIDEIATLLNAAPRAAMAFVRKVDLTD